MKLLVLTDRRQSAAAGRDLIETLAEVVAAGAPTVLFREKDLPVDERRALGERVAEACATAGAELTVASDPALARMLGAGFAGAIGRRQTGGRRGQGLQAALSGQIGGPAWDCARGRGEVL